MHDDKLQLNIDKTATTTPKKQHFSGAVLSTAYLPPIDFFRAMYQHDHILLEAHENYNKQSYRNRCHIAGANGVEVLSIPVESNSGKKVSIRDVRLSQHGQWQQTHWRALQAAYNSSPFFEYYEDELAHFYENKYQFLWDYNWDLLTLVLNFLDWDKKMQLTDSYEVNCEGKQDLRAIIHPKKATVFEKRPYYQVFREKHGFLSDLSIVDLLFNMGNESIFIIK